MQRRPFLATLVLSGLATAAPKPEVLRVQLGKADRRHGHDALGVGSYPGSLHAGVAHDGRVSEVTLELPADAAFEDGLVRQVDLDGDGRDEIVQVVADRQAGAAVAVYGIELNGTRPFLSERARSPAVGRGRWLNPVGFGDFDGDGRMEVVSVSTPHIGGVLTLYRYQPPHLVPLARTGDVSNHVYGLREQRLSAVLQRGGRMVVVVPDQSRHRLRTLAVSRSVQWEPAMADVVFEHPIDRIMPTGAGGVEVQAGAERRVLLL